MASVSRFVPGHVLHCEPELAASHALLVKLDDIGVAQLTDDRDLALEAIDGGAGGGRLGHDQLEGDHLAGEVVARLVDDAHRTAAQLAQASCSTERAAGSPAASDRHITHHHSTFSPVAPASGPTMVRFGGAIAPQPAHRI